MKPRWSLVFVPALLGVGLLAGCEREYPESLEYSFQPYPLLNARNEKEVFGEGLGDQERQALADQLKPYFGTPRHPQVQVDEKLQQDLLVSKGLAEQVMSPQQVLDKGSSLYRQLCLYCHGINGNGGGPTGQFLNPLPRDFRQGKFKFRSTVKVDSGGKPDPAFVVPPSREDLKKTIRNGIPTANMPSFALLAEDELEALVSYVIHLSLRGQVEYRVARGSAEDVEAEVQRAAKRWLADSRTAFTPPPPPKPWGELHYEGRTTNYEKGKKLYVGEGGCKECHGADGRSSLLELPTNVTRRNDWGDLNAPRNLTLGAYRGGSRPIDIYYRIKLGIAGSGMPAASDKLRDEDIWYLVDYVMSLPQVR